MLVVLVEDNEILNHHLSSQLSDFGHTVHAEKTASACLQTIQKQPNADVMIIDLGLPDFDGFTLIKQIRRKEITVPILILTARGDWQDKVEGLNCGADDYLTKPFQFEELLARLEALVRRNQGFAASQIKAQSLTLNTQAKSIAYNETLLDLTALEYQIFEYLIRHSLQIVSKTQIADSLYSQGENVQLNNIEVIVSRLRKKLAQHTQDKLISTVRGQGYRFELEAK
ncbi:response regulator transcription factor [Vibrio coralliirubri]|uniref:response regulator transcription factor n=1 Tax=Vibrio coralliirubri TaxID=1516159 RepID=UPI000639B0B7|nr:response regulator transcription factor [Vibrio coralliirubri]CDU13417.1 DNA-binding response regulator in two-component regulatory system with PhoQ, PhoP [Vibrio coralliirubri]